MKKGTLFFALMVIVSIAHAQPDSLWSRTYGATYTDGCNSVEQTSDGGYVLAGYTSSFGAGNADFWLVKTDANGDSLWSRTYGGSMFDYCYSAQQTADGGYVLAGGTSSFGVGAPPHNNFWLVRTDSNGDSLWSRTFGGNLDELCLSVRQTSDGGYVLAGSTSSFGAGNVDFWLLKTDADGDSLWSRTFGGIAWDVCNSVQQTSDGGFILAGFSVSSGNMGFWLVKTDVNGDSLWTRRLGGLSASCNSVRQTADGGYVLAGSAQFVGSSFDMWLVKTNENGDSLWSRTFGGGTWDYCASVQQTLDGGYVLGGSTSSFGELYGDMWLVKTDVNGDSLWSRTFGGDSADYCKFVHQTSDGGYALAGGTASFGAGGSDFWLLKTGLVLPQPDISVTPSELNFGSVFVGDSAALPIVIHSTGDTNLIVSAITLPEDFHTDFAAPQTLAPGESLSVSVTFAPTEGRDYQDTLLVVSNAPNSAVPVPLSGAGIVDAADEERTAVRHYELHPIYPNPFNATTQIRFDVPRVALVQLRIYDLQGRVVENLASRVFEAGEHALTYDASARASGMYVLRMTATPLYPPAKAGGEWTAAQKLMLLK